MYINIIVKCIRATIRATLILIRLDIYLIIKFIILINTYRIYIDNKIYRKGL